MSDRFVGFRYELTPTVSHDEDIKAVIRGEMKLVRLYASLLLFDFGTMATPSLIVLLDSFFISTKIRPIIYTASNGLKNLKKPNSW